MLFEKGDWVWFVWKHGVYFLPVGEGPCSIPITPLWTTELSIYSALALATTDNHICIDHEENEYIYLTSFKQDDLHKRFGYHNESILEMIKGSTITQLNSDFDHYGFETKRRLDRDSINFIKKWLEDKPMKANNKVTPEIQVILDKVESFKARRVKPGDKLHVWKYIKKEKRWKAVGVRTVPIVKIVVKPPHVYKVLRAPKLIITSETIRKRPCLPNGEVKVFKGKIDKKVFSGDITKTTWPPKRKRVVS